MEGISISKGYRALALALAKGIALAKWMHTNIGHFNMVWDIQLFI